MMRHTALLLALAFIVLAQEVFEGETHTSVVPVVLTRGLRKALGQRRPG